MPDESSTKVKVDRRAYSRAYYERNKQKIKEYRKQHPEIQRAHNIRWHKKNPVLARFHRNRAKARAYGASGNHTLQEWLDLKKKYLYCCLACGMKEPFTDQKVQHLTEDHIVPLSRGGSHDIDNIQPLCFRCNNGKRTKSTDYRQA